MNNVICIIPMLSEVELITGPKLVPVDTISRITEAVYSPVDAQNTWSDVYLIINSIKKLKYKKEGNWWGNTQEFWQD